MKPTRRSCRLASRRSFIKTPRFKFCSRRWTEKNEQLQHARERSRQPNDPSRVAAQREVEKLQNQYKATWEGKYAQTRDRLLGLSDRVEGSPRSESIAELRNKVAALLKQKEKQAAQLKVMEAEQTATNDDTFEATYLDHQISSLMALEDQVRKNLEQVKFEAQSGQGSHRRRLFGTGLRPKSAWPKLIGQYEELRQGKHDQLLAALTRDDDKDKVKTRARMTTRTSRTTTTRRRRATPPSGSRNSYKT